MKRLYWELLLLAGLLVLGASPCVADVVTSTFDTGNEGWVSFGDGGAAVQFFATGGNPGGYVGLTDMMGTTLEAWSYLQSPSKFLVPVEYNGTFSFDLKTYNSDPSHFPTKYGVRAALVGNGLTLIDELTLPTASWQNYSFGLTETAGWRIFSNLNQDYSSSATVPTQTQLQGVLANLTGVFIAADYTDAYWADHPGVYDQTFVDNVRFTPVPEPSTIALLGISAFGLLALAWRKRKV